MGLPRPVLLRRVTNELQRCSGYIGSEIPFDPNEAVFPVEITVNMENVPAYAKTDGEIVQIKEHTYKLSINEEYPYEKPRARWETPIFHPNIMPPEDGGYVCIKLLDKWSFGSTLLSFIKAVEHLVMNPNPMNPFGADICVESSEFFLHNETKINASVSFGRS
ncbi:MAG: ubiquitin-conjugating enzyme E2 [Methanomassiliicoccaceae archaeon]|nr:ubiquitin-conjugating enzyme E2 [Methanomassiliicoccaceae archaeon]